MAFSISFTDFPEQYDSQNCTLEPNLSVLDLEHEHCFIEGDNYPVLKILSNDNRFKSKVNLIYIDPPYNTGNNFTYNDDFSLKSDCHSKWLSFMKRRLILARDLLCDSGCIFIAISQDELYVLKLLCDQIFGEENFINDFMWLHGKGKKDSWSRTLQQHSLCYGKNKKKLKYFSEFIETNWAIKNPDSDPRGNWFSGSISFSETRSNPNHKNFYKIISPSGKEWERQWFFPKADMEELIKNNMIFWGKSPEYDHVPRQKIFNGSSDKQIPKNIIDFTKSTREAQKHLDEILGYKGIFDNPKPVDLIMHLIKITNMPKDALILDFFAGSGTTMEAVLNLNKLDGGSRKCILVQKAESTFLEDGNKKIPRKACEKAFNAGFNSISEICKTRIMKITYGTQDRISFHRLLP